MFFDQPTVRNTERFNYIKQRKAIIHIWKADPANWHHFLKHESIWHFHLQMMTWLIVSVLNTTCNTEVELHSFSSSLGYFYKHISTTHNASRRLLGEDCSSGLLSHLSGHNTSLWTIDTCITTPDQSERNILLPWQQHYSLPHTLLAVRSILKGIPRVTDRVIYHTCHLAQRPLWSMQQLWSARCNNRAATCICQAQPCFIRLLCKLFSCSNTCGREVNASPPQTLLQR